MASQRQLFLVLPSLGCIICFMDIHLLCCDLNKLQAKRMMAKLDMYRKFTNALALAVIMSMGRICYELFLGDEMSMDIMLTLVTVSIPNRCTDSGVENFNLIAKSGDGSYTYTIYFVKLESFRDMNQEVFI